MSGGQGAVGDVKVSAIVRNVGSTAGADVAQLYLGDPAAAGEPPRQLVGYQRVSLRPGASERVQFTVTPRDESWWDDTAGGWSQSPGAYRVFVGDSSALANLPLRGGFVLASTPGARQVSVQSPSTVTPGTAFTVTARLSAAGNQTLRRVALALQLPEGWTAAPLGQTTFRNVSPGTAPSARFSVTPPSDSPNLNAIVHATATLGSDASREAGVTVTVS